jgi:hypothetical protein
MRNLVLIFSLIVSTFCLAQDTIVTISTPEIQILYYGLSTKIKVNTSLPFDYSLASSQLEIKALEEKNTFSIKPLSNSGNTATLKVLDPTTGKGNSVAEFNYKVFSLPDPELYIGSVKNGSSIDFYSNKKLSAKLPPSSYLNINFAILDWSVCVKGIQYEGSGSDLTDLVLIKINELKEGNVISIIATIIGPDGIKRKIGGVYTFR